MSVRPEALSSSAGERFGALGFLRSILPWVLAGLAIRLALAPFTSHPYDMAVWISHQARLFNGGFDPLTDWKFSVPLMALVLSSFGPAALTSELLHIPLVLADQFWIKLPLIAADIGVALLLGKYVLTVTGRSADARMAAILWLFNPAAIFYTSVHGQFDVLPALFLLWAFVALQSGNTGNTWAFALGASVAKFVGFFALPLLWAWGRHQRPRTWGQAVRPIISVVAVMGLAFGSVLVSEKGLDFVSGVESSLVRGENGSLWSLWALGPGPDGWIAAMWLPAFLVVYLAVVVAVLFRAERSDATVLLAAMTGVTCVLIVLDPFANPQFVIWVLPLAIALTSVVRSTVGLAATAVIGALNLAAFWMSEDPSIWLLNAVPQIHDLDGDRVTLAGFVNLQAAERVGLLYAAGVLAFGAWAFRLAWRTKARSETGRWWRNTAIVVSFGGALLAVGFLELTYQPTLVKEYARAPQYPHELKRLNMFPATTVSWLSRPDGKLWASWAEGRLTGIRDQTENPTTMRIVVREALSPSVESSTASRATPISARGVREEFRLVRPSLKTRMKLLLGNSRFGHDGGPRLPEISVFADPGFKTRLETRATVQKETSPGWFIVLVDQIEERPAELYRVEVRAPLQAGWVWDGASSDGVETRRAQRSGNAVTQWLNVWSLKEARGNGSPAVPGTMRIRSDAQVELVVHPRQGQDPAKGVTVIVPPAMRRPELPSVFLSYDLEAEPWWRAAPWTIVVIPATCMAFVLIFCFTVCRLSRWAWNGPDDVI